MSLAGKRTSICFYREQMEVSETQASPAITVPSRRHITTENKTRSERNEVVVWEIQGKGNRTTHSKTEYTLSLNATTS